MSSNISLENKHDLQHIVVAIIKETRHEVLKKIQVTRNFLNIRNFDSKQNTEVLAERKKKYDANRK